MVYGLGTSLIMCMYYIRLYQYKKYASDPNIRGYILPVFKAIPILHSLANTLDIRYHEAAS